MKPDETYPEASAELVLDEKRLQEVVGGARKEAYCPICGTLLVRKGECISCVIDQREVK